MRLAAIAVENGIAQSVIFLAIIGSWRTIDAGLLLVLCRNNLLAALYDVPQDQDDRNAGKCSQHYE